MRDFGVQSTRQNPIGQARVLVKQGDLSDSASARSRRRHPRWWQRRHRRVGREQAHCSGQHPTRRRTTSRRGPAPPPPSSRTQETFTRRSQDSGGQPPRAALDTPPPPTTSSTSPPRHRPRNHGPDCARVCCGRRLCSLCPCTDCDNHRPVRHLPLLFSHVVHSPLPPCRDGNTVVEVITIDPFAGLPTTQIIQTLPPAADSSIPPDPASSIPDPAAPPPSLSPSSTVQIAPTTIPDVQQGPVGAPAPTTGPLGPIVYTYTTTDANGTQPQLFNPTANASRLRCQVPPLPSSIPSLPQVLPQHPSLHRIQVQY